MSGGRTGALLRSDARWLPPCAPRAALSLSAGAASAPPWRVRRAPRRHRPGSRARPAADPLRPCERSRAPSSAISRTAAAPAASLHVRDGARAVARRRVALLLERGVHLAQRVRMHAELGGAGADRGQRRTLGNRSRVDRESELGHQLRGRCESAVSVEGHARVGEGHACRHAADELRRRSDACKRGSSRVRIGPASAWGPGGAARWPRTRSPKISRWRLSARSLRSSSSLPAQSCIRTPARSASRTTARTSCAPCCASAPSADITFRSAPRSGSSSWPTPAASISWARACARPIRWRSPICAPTPSA